MQTHALVYPMFAMVVLSFTVLVALFRARVGAVREGSVRPQYFATFQEGAEPASSVQLARHFTNLFEAPVLFYVACLAAMVVGREDTGLLLLAWAYVALRFVHAIVHTGRNVVNQRVAVYFSSWIVLLGMWAWIAIGVAMAR